MCSWYFIVLINEQVSITCVNIRTTNYVEDGVTNMVAMSMLLNKQHYDSKIYIKYVSVQIITAIID